MAKLIVIKIDINSPLGYHFSNNVKRIISGKLTLTGKGGEGRFSVKYDTFPLSYDASLVVLDTDYRNYAVSYID